MISTDNVKKANSLKIETIIKNLKKRDITGYYAEDRSEALKLALDVIPEGATVGKGGSETMNQLGIIPVLKEGNYTLLDAFASTNPEVQKETKRKIFFADVMLTSANAITLNGEIVNIDGTGNRMAAVIWGPDKVIFVVGTNKIVESVDNAVDRIKCDACPPNCIRLGKKTPCAITGKCGDCLSLGNTTCCHTIVTRFSSIEGRMHVIMVNESLGF
ncbi:MAG: lactate utilization protein [Eubacteriales bacterium]|nr:lactate utilization protein [Eubacteriales bacterium]